MRRPWRLDRRPTATAAPAEPPAKSAEGSPAPLVEPSISLARRAPTLTPAARPAPAKIWAKTKTRSVRRCTTRTSRSSTRTVGLAADAVFMGRGSRGLALNRVAGAFGVVPVVIDVDDITVGAVQDRGPDGGAVAGLA